jgi:hypothetical protein
LWRKDDTYALKRQIHPGGWAGKEVREGELQIPPPLEAAERVYASDGERDSERLKTKFQHELLCNSCKSGSAKRYPTTKADRLVENTREAATTSHRRCPARATKPLSLCHCSLSTIALPRLGEVRERFCGAPIDDEANTRGAHEALPAQTNGRRRVAHERVGVPKQ